jgi:DNA repair protein RadA/Sms
MANQRACKICARLIPEGQISCPLCGRSYLSIPKALTGGASDTAKFATSVPLNKVQATYIPRISTGPWDVAFGTSYDDEGNEIESGLTLGTANLIAGEPGAGKSTLSIQLACEAANRCKGEEWVLYIATEERSQLIRARANRLKLTIPDNLRIEDASAGELVPSEYLASLALKPKLVILDSLDGMAADPVSESHKFREFLKSGVVFILISHVNKGMDIAGRIDVQHNVDATFAFVGIDDEEDHRELMSIKNRNGEAKVRVRFLMTREGLEVVEDYDPLKFGSLPTKEDYESRLEGPVELPADEDEVCEISEEKAFETLCKVVDDWKVEKGKDEKEACLDFIELMLNAAGYTWQQDSKH